MIRPQCLYPPTRIFVVVVVVVVYEHNRTPSGKKTVTGVQVVTASEVQSIRCRWQAISSCP